MRSLTSRHTSQLSVCERGTAFIAVEAVYSMDGDKAPLGDLVALAEEFDAALIVDEAHSLGVRLYRLYSGFQVD